MIYRNDQMSLIKCEDIARAIEMVGGAVEVHDWISLSDRSKDFLVSVFKAYSNMELKVTYMCFGCGMTGKRCEDCHYLCNQMFLIFLIMLLIFSFVVRMV